MNNVQNYVIINYNPTFKAKPTKTIKNIECKIPSITAASVACITAYNNVVTDKQGETKVGFPNLHTEKGLKEVFQSPHFKISKQSCYNRDYLYIKDSNDNFLCCIRGNQNEDNYYGTDYTTPNKGNSKNDFALAIIEHVNPEYQDLIFSDKMFNLEKPSKYAIERFKENAKEENEIKRILAQKPEFVSYKPTKHKIKGVNMRNYLTVPATKTDNYIGTFGLGPCIGLALIGKKDGKPVNISIAHIDALTNIKSLVPLYFATMKDATEYEVVMVSSGNEQQRAIEILKLLRLGAHGDHSTKVSADLTASTSMAINTKTGEVSINIPVDEYNMDKERPNIAYMTPSELWESSHSSSF